MKRGPIARPSVYKVKGRMAASDDTAKACWMSRPAGTVIEEANVLKHRWLELLLARKCLGPTSRMRGLKEELCGRSSSACSSSWDSSSPVGHSSQGVSLHRRS